MRVVWHCRRRMASRDSVHSFPFGLDSMHHFVMIPYAHKVSNSIPQQVADSMHAFRRDQGGRARVSSPKASIPLFDYYGERRGFEYEWGEDENKQRDNF